MTAWFLWQTMQKDGGANIAVASRFLWLRISYVCLILSFHWFISASFSILAFFKESWSLTGYFFSNNIYVALVTQGLLCYNIATLGMFTSFSGGSRGGAREARKPTHPPPPSIWTRHCRCQCRLNVLLSSQLKSIKNHLPLHHEHIHGVVASPARKVGTGYNCTPTHHGHLLLWTWLKI